MPAHGDLRPRNGELRRRKPESQHGARNFQPHVTTPEEKPAPQPRSKTPSSMSGFLLILLCFAISFLFMLAVNIQNKHRLLNLHEEQPTPERPFVTENALAHIRRIAPKRRWIGSLALEESLQYIQAELLALQTVAEKNDMVLEVELFRSGPGSYLIDIMGLELPTTYSDIPSVVARLRPASLSVDTKEKAFLVSAHVDSAVSAPGASDDVVGVAVGMEVARCIASSTFYELKRPVLFVFNGGEEAVCTGAHSFVTQHKWASTIAAHINLESLGPGSAFHLFRLSSHNAWLVEAFADSVTLPLASVISSDFFEAKLIPGETDFRIFDETGGIPGYDVVLLDNGYVYHTVHDSIEKVDPVGVKHGGVITLELVLAMAGSADAIGFNERGAVKQSNFDRFYQAIIKFSTAVGLVKDPERPRAVFFDLLLMKTIVYEEGFATIFNITVLLSTVLIWYSKLTKMSAEDRRTSFRMVGVLLACLLGSFASATFASLVYVEIYGAKMQWYGSSVLACVMFAPPALFGAVSAMILLLPRRMTTVRYTQMLFACTIHHAAMALIFMSVGFMSSYMPILLLLVNNICALQGEAIHPVLRHLQISGAHAVLGSGLVKVTLSAILPILGRMRIDIVHHDTIAALIVAYLGFYFVIQPALPIFCQYPSSLRKVQGLAFFCATGIAAYFVAYGRAVGEQAVHSMYSSDAPKRIISWHFYSPMQKPQSVICVGSQDAIPADTARLMSKIFETEGKHEALPDYPLWGSMESTSIETYRPFRAFLQSVSTFQADERPTLPLPTAMVLAEEEVLGGWNVTIQVEAQDSHHLTVRFPTGNNTSVVDWSLDVPLTDRPHGAWIRHVGSYEFKFWVVLRKEENVSVRPKHKITVTSCRLGASKSPSHLSKLIAEDWESHALLATTGMEYEL